MSAGSYQDLKNWNLLQSGQALGIMTAAGKLSNADAIFVGVRSCCLLPSHRNNFVEDQVCAVEKWAISSGDRRRHSKDICCAVTVCVHLLVLSTALCKNFPQMFSCLRGSDRPS